jgi:hypothetical protein
MRFVDTTRRGHAAYALAALTFVAASGYAARARADDLPPSEPPATPVSPPPAPPPVGLDAPPAAAEEAPPPRPKRASGFSGRLHGGLGQRKVFSDSVLGADLTGSLGGYIESVSIYADLQLLFASDKGLAFRQYRIGPSIDFEVISRLRLGAGLSMGVTTLTRATNGKVLEAWSWGAHLLASFDLFQLEGRTAIYLLGELSVDTAGTFLGSDSRRAVGTTVMWGPTIAAGVRF